MTNESRPIWTEGICGDGAAILRDGVMQPIEEVIAALNAAELSQPEPEGEGPSLAEIAELTWQHSSDLGDLRIGVAPDDVPALVAAALARWAHPATPPPLPAPEGRPTDEDLYDLADVFNGDPVPAMRRALELWGHPTIEPVPVAERPWEREGWCDAEQTCWAIGHRDRWERVYVLGRDWSNPTYTHLLPHHALPLPTPTP
jgi:hypothetical protein